MLLVLPLQIQSEGDQVTFNKEGAWVLGKGDTLEARIVASSTSGTAIARFSYYMEDK